MIQLLVLDVDGCLTNGGICYTENGDEKKTFNVKDGLGIATWNKMGNYSAIITGKNSGMVERRAKELGVHFIHQGIKDKDKVLEDIVKSLGITFDEVGAIGDDLNDYKMLKIVGESFTPKDGVEDIKGIVSTIVSRNGGDGAVREMIDILVDKNSQKDLFMARWI